MENSSRNSRPNTIIVPITGGTMMISTSQGPGYETTIFLITGERLVTSTSRSLADATVTPPPTTFSATDVGRSMMSGNSSRTYRSSGVDQSSTSSLFPPGGMSFTTRSGGFRYETYIFPITRGTVIISTSRRMSHQDPFITPIGGGRAIDNSRSLGDQQQQHIITPNCGLMVNRDTQQRRRPDDNHDLSSRRLMYRLLRRVGCHHTPSVGRIGRIKDRATAKRRKSSGSRHGKADFKILRIGGRRFIIRPVSSRRFIIRPVSSRRHGPSGHRTMTNGSNRVVGRNGGFSHPFSDHRVLNNASSRLRQMLPPTVPPIPTLRPALPPTLPPTLPPALSPLRNTSGSLSGLPIGGIKGRMMLPDNQLTPSDIAELRRIQNQRRRLNEEWRLCREARRLIDAGQLTEERRRWIMEERRRLIAEERREIEEERRQIAEDRRRIETLFARMIGGMRQQMTSIIATIMGTLMVGASNNVQQRQANIRRRRSSREGEGRMERFSAPIHGNQRHFIPTFLQGPAAIITTHMATTIIMAIVMITAVIMSMGQVGRRRVYTSPSSPKG